MGTITPEGLAVFTIIMLIAVLWAGKVDASRRK